MYINFVAKNSIDSITRGNRFPHVCYVVLSRSLLFANFLSFYTLTVCYQLSPKLEFSESPYIFLSFRDYSAFCLSISLYPFPFHIAEKFCNFVISFEMKLIPTLAWWIGIVELEICKSRVSFTSWASIAGESCLWKRGVCRVVDPWLSWHVPPDIRQI